MTSDAHVRPSTSSATLRTVFLLDVDNTLLNNDQFSADLGAKLKQSFGATEHDRYWALYGQLRDAQGYADYLGALQLFRVGLDNHPALLQMSAWLLEYPFTQLLYSRAMDVIAHLHALGQPVILSDGDIVFQPRKVKRAGLWDALDGNVLIYVHKQQMLEAMQQRYPATRYVMVDDKPNILADMKARMGERLTTIFVKQGHYAAAAPATIHPAPDIEIARIGDLLERKLEDFLPAPVAVTSVLK